MINLMTSVFKINNINTYLFRDNSTEPVLGQIDFWNQAVVMWDVSQEDARESHHSIWHDAGTEQEKDDRLEASPLTQKCYHPFIILHCLSVCVLIFQEKKKVSLQFYNFGDFFRGGGKGGGCPVFTVHSCQ